MNNPFTGMRDAKTFERGVFLDIGLYEVEIQKCIYKETRKSGDAFIAELMVTKTTNPKHPVGSKASWYQGLRDRDIGFGSLKAFCYAVLGVETNTPAAAEIDPQIEALMADAVGPKQAFRGQKLKVQVSHVQTQKGQTFSRHEWSKP